MENFQYTISILFGRKDVLVEPNIIVALANSIADYFSLSYSNFSYTVVDGKPTTKAHKLNKKNLGRLALIDSRKLTGISFEKFKEKKSYTDTIITLIITTNGSGDFPSSINICVDSQAVNKPFGTQELIEIVRRLELYQIDTKYGLALCMPTEKLPMVYLAGMSTPGVTREEEESVYAFTRNIKLYKTKIWDIFWMNVINKRLITLDMLKKITKVVTETNVMEDGDKYIISLPVEPCEYMANNMKTQRLKAKLRKIFREKDLIMYK